MNVGKFCVGLVDYIGNIVIIFLYCIALHAFIHDELGRPTGLIRFSSYVVGARIDIGSTLALGGTILLNSLALNDDA